MAEAKAETRFTFEGFRSILRRAKAEGWTELAILPPSSSWTDEIYEVRLKSMGWHCVRAFTLVERLETIPADLAELTSLTSLCLQGHDIGPEGMRLLAWLTNLRVLDLKGNRIGSEGARAIAKLSGLISLDISHNKIESDGVRAFLDAFLALGSACRLEKLDLGWNGDLSSLLPPDALHTTDAPAILAAYRRFRDARHAKVLQPLNEAKLLVVGNEAVGKTSLIKYLIDDEPRNPNQAKTPGIALHEKIDTRKWHSAGAGVTLNVWDFGGQEIMHHTHRFFLTARSLYLLVLEARREDDRTIYDWLRTIRNRGGDSPIIVVINKCEPPRDLRLDESGLKREYPNIVAFVRTSCNPDGAAKASIAALRKLIAATLAYDSRLKHVRDGVPPAWFRVKGALAEMARKERVLSVREYERLCEGDGWPGLEADELVTDRDEQRGLLRMVHDLGVVVAHGLERHAPAAMRNVTLLDPNWLTGAIYTLLNSSRIKDQGGEFTWKQLGELLDPREYPEDRHEYIIEMMEHEDVGLCFELANSHRQRFLIPEALPASEPDYGVWPKESLRFRYDYSLLPGGLIPRFIVQAHSKLTKKPTKWRTGVMLEAADCRVLVRADLDRKRVNIQVAGPENMRRSALNVVLVDLNEVHRLNPETKPKAMVPLTDEPDLAVSYEHLRTLEERYGLEHRFDPDGAARVYSVRELLEGVRLERWSKEEVAHLTERLLQEAETVKAHGAPKQGTTLKTTLVSKPTGSAIIKAVGQIVTLLAAIAGFIVVLGGVVGLVWYFSESMTAVITVGLLTVLVLVAVLAFVAATTGIFRGTQLERLLLAVLEKTSLLPGLLGERKKPRSPGGEGS